MPQKWPSKSQWRYFFKILSNKERVVFSFFLFLFFVSFSFILINLYFKNTEIKPTFGGSFIEGVIGFPRVINPVYAEENDVDRDLSELIYSGLMKYNEKGEIVKDLAERYEILEDGKVFEFYLKENLLWSDNTPLSADDVVFTIKAIQMSMASPIRASWLGVEVEKISELGVRFKLGKPSSVFLENCTLKIMPKHVWEKFSDQNFRVEIYYDDLEMVSSGPYKIKKESLIQKGKTIKSLELTVNLNYHGKLPYIQNITLFFFDKEDELISAFNSGEIDGFSLVSPKKYQQLKKEGGFSVYHFLMPRYFAVFFNPEKSKVLADKNVRLALNYGTNKKEVIDQIFSGQARIVDSPILSDFYGFQAPENIYEFNLDKAKQILQEAGFIEKESGIREKIIVKKPAFQFTRDLQVGSTGEEVRELQKCLAKDSDVYPEGEITGAFREKTKIAVIKFQEKYKEEILDPYGLKQGTGRVLESTRKKLNELCAPTQEETLTLSLVLTTFSSNADNQSILASTALLLKKQWEALGIKVEIEFNKGSSFSLFLEEKIRPRNYEMILFGQVLGINPDLSPFWHSSQTKNPGWNLTTYGNKESDKLLEETLQTLNREEIKKNLEKFQDNLIKEAPAVFLYNPDYLYIVSKEIKGMLEGRKISDPSQRFADITNWYIKTKRAWK